MIDTHCHVFKEYYINIDEVINKMDNNIVIVSGTNDQDNKEVLELCKKYPNVYGTIGIHPTEECSSNSLKFIEENLNNEKIVGIGEIGLDYYWNKDNKEKQKEIFIKQLDLARKFNKPVVIHNREATNDTYEILKDYPELKKDIHCYSGSLEMAKNFIKLNCRLGIGGVVTFKNSKLKDVLKEIDLKYLMLETDSPFLTPEPYRGKQNEPYNIIYVAKTLSEIKGISLEEVLKQTTLNAIDQFNLKIKL